MAIKESRSHSPRERNKAVEGIRDITLYAHVRAGYGRNRQSTTDTKLVENASIDNIKQIVQDYENELCKKFGAEWDYDEDEVFVDIMDNFGWSGVKAEFQTKDSTGFSPEDDTYNVGYR